MKKFDLSWAKEELSKLNPDNKYDTMLRTAAILTKLLEPEQTKPVIVGGFAVEIYTDQNYSTRDLDMVVEEQEKSYKILKELGFKKKNRHLVNDNLEIMIEFPSEVLTGLYDKIEIDSSGELFVYVISREDIIMDRLRAYIYWKEEDSKIWGLKILSRYLDSLNFEYLQKVGSGSENQEESIEIQKWIQEVKVI